MLTEYMIMTSNIGSVLSVCQYFLNGRSERCGPLNTGATLPQGKYEHSRDDHIGGDRHGGAGRDEPLDVVGELNAQAVNRETEYIQ